MRLIIEIEDEYKINNLIDYLKCIEIDEEFIKRITFESDVK